MTLVFIKTAALEAVVYFIPKNCKIYKTVTPVSAIIIKDGKSSFWKNLLFLPFRKYKRVIIIGDATKNLMNPSNMGENDSSVANFTATNEPAQFNDVNEIIIEYLLTIYLLGKVPISKNKFLQKNNIKMTIFKLYCIIINICQ